MEDRNTFKKRKTMSKGIYSMNKGKNELSE